MNDATREYMVLERDPASIDGKPRFTGYQIQQGGMADYVVSYGPIELGRALIMVMDEPELRRQDNWPGEIGALNVSGGRILVTSDAREALREHIAPGMELHPAVLQHYDGTYLEPFYYLHIWERRDIWDRKLSTYEAPFDPEKRRVAYLDQIVLNEEKLSLIPFEDRMIVLLDKVGGTVTLFHRDLVKKLTEAGLTNGAKFYPLEDWFPGIQHQPQN